MKEFNIALDNNSRLKGNQLTSYGMATLFDKLSEIDSRIEVYDLSCIQIGGDYMHILGKFIERNKHVVQVHMRKAWITDFEIRILVPYLYGNPKLRYLNISENQGISDKSIHHLKKAIESSHIEDVNTNYTSIKDAKGLTLLLANNMIKNKSTIFSMQHKGIDDQELMDICELFSNYDIDSLETIEYV